MTSEIPDSSFPLEIILERYRQDREGGRVRSLREYLAEFHALVRDHLGPEALSDSLTEGILLHHAEQEDMQRVGPYRLLREIGRGGQGLVFVAEDMRLRRQVALKVLTGLGPDAGNHLRRFQREAEVASRLDHPGICGVLDTGIDRGVPYIAMRYIEGETLARRIAETRSQEMGDETTSFVFQRSEIVQDGSPASPSGSSGEPTSSMSKGQLQGLLEVFEKTARALHVAHEAGIIHRDIKPGNIMLSKENEPVILDFGLARDEDHDQPSITQSGDLFGTPSYMSPEQIAGQRIQLDCRSDVYSLGVALYECLTLTRPFEAPTREALYQAIITKSPPDPRRFNPAISKELKLVLETALEKDRDRRYQSAKDLAEDLRRLREHEPILACPVPLHVRALHWGQRNPTLALAFAGIFLVLAVGLAIALYLLGKTKIALRGEAAARSLAVQERNRADRNLAEFERLADVKRLLELKRTAKQSWPPVPAALNGPEGMEDWLTQAEMLVSRRLRHLAALVELRRQALPLPDGEDDARRHQNLEKVAEALRAMGEREGDPDAEPQEVIRARRTLEAEFRALEDLGFTWVFADPTLGWRQDILAELVRDLGEFDTTITTVTKHRDFVRTVETETLVKPAKLWADTTRTIRDRRVSSLYHGLEMTPQLGLVPLGRDPASNLFEFLHRQTGVAPEREASTGRWRITEETGIILVLIPAGTFWIGAQADSPDEPNYDPFARPIDARPGSGGVREVEIPEPFFLSKYEMTQGQWLRATGHNPSLFQPGYRTPNGSPDLTHPVESVSWNECISVLRSLGLELPSETQWEYAARATTGSVWWTGDNRKDLQDAGNLADRFLHANAGPPELGYEEWLDDGRTFPAPVGCYRPNRWGLHDVVGNLYEWCADELEAGLRIARGGSFLTRAGDARSGARNFGPPDVGTREGGLRPMRRLDP